MLDNFNTGYEGRFDFAPRQSAPAQAYLLASVPRAGSTFLSHILWRTGCLGAPLEYLNFDPNGPYGFASNSAELQVELWHSVLRRRCSPNGIFGLKAFPTQFEELKRRNNPLLLAALDIILPRTRNKCVIYLRRRDRVAQAVSLARASITGVWRKDQETAGGHSLRYDEAAIKAAEQGIELQERVWEKLFGDLAIEPLQLWHEDVLSDPAQAANRVAEHLGVRLEASRAVEVPEISRQSAGNAPDWIEQYSESRGPVKGARRQEA